MCDCAEGRRGIYACIIETCVEQLVAYGRNNYGIGRMQ